MGSIRGVRLSLRAQRRAVRQRATVYARWLRPPRYHGLQWTPKRLANFYLARLDEWRVRTIVRATPLRLHLESNNTCNLHCTGCPTGLGLLTRSKAYVSVEEVARIFDEIGDRLLYFEPYVWGDPMVHPQICDIVRLATSRGVATLISTNLSMNFTQEMAEDLVRTNIGVIGIAIDGATQETYEIYRRGGDLERVLNNVRLLVDARRRTGAAKLRILWEYHVFPHNEHETEKARAMATELGIEFCPSRAWLIGKDVRPERPIPGIRCFYLWGDATIRPQGAVSACCGSVRAADDLGNMSEGGVMRAWNNERFQMARQLFRDRDRATDEAKELICYDCPVLLAYDGLKRHVSTGGAASLYRSDYLPNEGYNFVMNRARTTADGELIPLAAVSKAL